MLPSSLVSCIFFPISSSVALLPFARVSSACCLPPNESEKMYNGIGLQTPRGSGTTGYVQTNKFFLKSRQPPVLPDATASGSKPAGAPRNPNKEIVEHNRKRQIQSKLLMLQEALTDQGYTEAEIAGRLEEARKTLEAESAAAAAGKDRQRWFYLQ